MNVEKWPVKQKPCLCVYVCDNKGVFINPHKYAIDFSLNCLSFQRVRPLGGPPAAQSPHSSANVRPQISSRLFHCHSFI